MKSQHCSQSAHKHTRTHTHIYIYILVTAELLALIPLFHPQDTHKSKMSGYYVANPLPGNYIETFKNQSTPTSILSQSVPDFS